MDDIVINLSKSINRIISSKVTDMVNEKLGTHANLDINSLHLSYNKNGNFTITIDAMGNLSLEDIKKILKSK